MPLRVTSENSAASATNPSIGRTLTAHAISTSRARARRQGGTAQADQRRDSDRQQARQQAGDGGQSHQRDCDHGDGQQLAEEHVPASGGSRQDHLPGAMPVLGCEQVAGQRSRPSPGNPRIPRTRARPARRRTRTGEPKPRTACRRAGRSAASAPARTPAAPADTRAQAPASTAAAVSLRSSARKTLAVSDGRRPDGAADRQGLVLLPVRGRDDRRGAHRSADRRRPACRQPCTRWIGQVEEHRLKRAC